MDALELVADVRYTDAVGLPDAIEFAEILLLWDFFSTALRAAWPRARALKWMHVAAAGVDAVLFDELSRSDVVLTNAHGFFDGPIAEFVLANILAHDKQLHENRTLQHLHEWRHRETRRTAGSTALVVGTGGIGRQIARLLRAVGREVQGAGRRASIDDPNFGTIVSSAALAEHVGWADNVVVVAPLTCETRGMIDAAVLKKMKASAHLLSVGRGQLIDEVALLHALQAGSIAAVSLDVFVTEPLLATSPLWDAPGVRVSAHMSGDVAGWRDGLARWSGHAIHEKTLPAGEQARRWLMSWTRILVTWLAYAEPFAELAPRRARKLFAARREIALNGCERCKDSGRQMCRLRANAGARTSRAGEHIQRKRQADSPCGVRF